MRVHNNVHFGYSRSIDSMVWYFYGVILFDWAKNERMMEDSVFGSISVCCLRG